MTEADGEGGDGRLLTWLGRPGAHRVVLGLGLLLTLPSLAIGFFSDDWYMLAALRGRLPGGPPWWDLYAFLPSSDAGVRAYITAGALPWFAVASLRLHLVRPLSSALLTLDNRAFGDHAVLWHLHSLLWWALLLVLLGTLYRRILPRATANLALLLFAIAPGHVLPYAWPSSRHVILAAVPVALAILSYLRFRESGWRPGHLVAIGLLIIGLMASEATLGGVAFLVTYDLFGGEPRPAVHRLARSLPLLALSAIYLVIYRLAGGGTVGSDAYVTPFPDFGEFLRTVSIRVPMLSGQAILGVPGEVALGHPPWPFVLLGIVGVGFATVVWRSASARADMLERAALRWLVPGAALALLGASGGLPGGRVLVVANIGFAVLLAVLIRRGLERGANRTSSLGARVLAAVHVVLAPLAAIASMLGTLDGARVENRVARAIPDEVTPARRVFMLAASDPLVSLYAGFTLLAEGAPIDCLARFSNTRADMRVTRVGPSRIMLAPIGVPLARGVFETLYRSRSFPFAVGDDVMSCGAHVRVAAIADGSPTLLDVDFGTPLEDPNLALLAWDGERLLRTRITDGETRVLPWRSGPLRTQ